VLARADRVTVTTPELREDLIRRHPRLAPDKLLVIYNGYDEPDFEAVGFLPPRPRFEILHAGLVIPSYRDPVPFLRAVAKLIAAGDLAREETAVVFLGSGQYVESAEFRAAVHGLGLDDVVEVHGRVSHRETLRRLQQAAVLLLLQGTDTQSQIPAKAFEYLRAGRPILALAIEGATTRLLADLGASIIVDPSSVDAIAAALRSVYRAWQVDPERVARVPGVARFGRAALTAELAAVLDDLTGARALTPSELEKGACDVR
jgi:glycosyltransferase involved in cell wall biosynthesis